MDQHELFQSCRRGDLDHVRFLVEQKEVDLNIRDPWDSTPLYYACLCGHYDVVSYLLEQGAKCEANTFDGERCLYGALNDEIRNMLRNFKVISSQRIRRDGYQEFLRRLLESGDCADVCFSVHSHKFSAHRCILSCRSPYFAEMFMNKWQEREEIQLSHPLVQPYTFRLILQYIYTGMLEVPVDQVELVLMLAKQCKLYDLVDSLDEKCHNAQAFETTKPGTNVTVISVEEEHDSTRLQDDLGVLAEQSLPVELAHWVSGSELPFYPSERAPFADICFCVDDHYFMCHKLFFCSRCEYFRILLQDHFNEISCHADTGVPVVRVSNLSADVFTCIVYYIYSDSAPLTADCVYDVLCAADMLLLPGLKRQCGVKLAQHIDVGNVVNMLRTARGFDLPRLEAISTEFVANNLEVMVKNSDFKNVIVEDARNVKEREETDTIDVVDNVRYHISRNVQTYSEIAEADAKLEMLDRLLENLDLDA